MKKSVTILNLLILISLSHLNARTYPVTINGSWSVNGLLLNLRDGRYSVINNENRYVEQGTYSYSSGRLVMKSYTSPQSAQYEVSFKGDRMTWSNANKYFELTPYKSSDYLANPNSSGYSVDVQMRYLNDMSQKALELIKNGSAEELENNVSKHAYQINNSAADVYRTRTTQKLYREQRKEIDRNTCIKMMNEYYNALNSGDIDYATRIYESLKIYEENSK